MKGGKGGGNGRKEEVGGRWGIKEGKREEDKEERGYRKRGRRGGNREEQEENRGKSSGVESERKRMGRISCRSL